MRVSEGMFGFRPNIATPNLRLATGILVGVWLTTKARLATARKPSRHTFFPRKFGGHFHRHTDLWRATAAKKLPNNHDKFTVPQLLSDISPPPSLLISHPWLLSTSFPWQILSRGHAR